MTHRNACDCPRCARTNLVFYIHDLTPEDLTVELANGASVHDRGDYDRTPLHEVLLMNYHPLPKVELLLDAGADASAVDHDGVTPLMLALMHHSDTVFPLLEAGTSLAPQGIYTDVPLAGAKVSLVPRWYDYRADFFLLLDHGAPLEGKDDRGRTPLIIMAMRGDKDKMLLLLEAGANEWATDRNEFFAWDYYPFPPLRDPLLVHARAVLAYPRMCENMARLIAELLLAPSPHPASFA